MKHCKKTQDFGIDPIEETPLFSNRVTFRSLDNGVKFIFASEREPNFYDIARGPWIKKSSRLYVHIDAPTTSIEVGTVSVAVLPLA